MAGMVIIHEMQNFMVDWVRSRKMIHALLLETVPYEELSGGRVYLKIHSI